MMAQKEYDEHTKQIMAKQAKIHKLEDIIREQKKIIDAAHFLIEQSTARQQTLRDEADKIRELPDDD